MRGSWVCKRYFFLSELLFLIEAQIFWYDIHIEERRTNDSVCSWLLPTPWTRYAPYREILFYTVLKLLKSFNRALRTAMRKNCYFVQIKKRSHLGQRQTCGHIAWWANKVLGKEGGLGIMAWWTDHGFCISSPHLSVRYSYSDLQPTPLHVVPWTPEF